MLPWKFILVCLISFIKYCSEKAEVFSFVKTLPAVIVLGNAWRIFITKVGLIYT